MAFKLNKMSSLVLTDPAEAFKKLAKLFAANGGNVKTVAPLIGVDRATIFRWLKRFERDGLGDPREGVRGITGRKPSGMNKRRRARPVLKNDAETRGSVEVEEKR